MSSRKTHDNVVESATYTGTKRSTLKENGTAFRIPKRSVIFDAMFAHGEQVSIDHSRVKREEEKVSVRAMVTKLCFP